MLLLGIRLQTLQGFLSVLNYFVHFVLSVGVTSVGVQRAFRGIQRSACSHVEQTLIRVFRSLVLCLLGFGSVTDVLFFLLLELDSLTLCFPSLVLGGVVPDRTNLRLYVPPELSLKLD